MEHTQELLDYKVSTELNRKLSKKLETNIRIKTKN